MPSGTATIAERFEARLAHAEAHDRHMAPTEGATEHHTQAFQGFSGVRLVEFVDQRMASSDTPSMARLYRPAIAAAFELKRLPSRMYRLTMSAERWPV